jgi:hypothetical protein
MAHERKDTRFSGDERRDRARKRPVSWLPLHCFTRLTLQRMSTWRFIAGAHTTGARNHAGQLAHDSHDPHIAIREPLVTRSSARRGRLLCADRHALN